MGTRAHFDKPADDPCYDPRMTRAQAIARRTAGTLRENCVVVITDGPTIGTPGNTSITEIELNPTSPTELGLTARVHQTFDNSAWEGIYDIDLGVSGSITRLTDSSQNTAVDNDADSPTVHTQVPWHLGTTIGGVWRDNYFEDAVLTAADTVVAPKSVTNSRFINTTMDFTGWTTGSISTTLVQGSGTHHIFGGFALWTRSNIIDATVNAVTDIINLTGADIADSGTSVSTTGNGTISVTNSRIEDAAIVLNAGEANITITNSTIRESAQIQNDALSLKAISLFNSTIEGAAIIRGQAGTIVRSVIVSNSTVQGKPAGDTMIFRDDASATLLFCDIYNGSSTWLIDGPAAFTSLQWTGIKWIGGTLTHGTAATNCQWTDAELIDCFVDVQGPGEAGFATVVRQSHLVNTVIRHSAGVTESLNIQNVEANGAPGAVIAIDAASPRGLSIDGGTTLTGAFSIIQTGTTAPSGGGADDDRVFNCTLQGGVIEFATTVGGIVPHTISNSLIVGGPNAPGVPDGVIRIDGTSARVQVFQCEIWGELTITDVPEGALSGPTSVYDNYIGSSCNLRYIGGDATFKQVRNNRIEGNSSSILCTGLTGSAGAALADVFSNRVANQSVLTCTGARVPGFPVRNNSVENGSTLTVPASGSILQCSLQNNADLDTGAFVHFDGEISGAFTKVATAANTNSLTNKSFDDWV